MTVMTDNEVIGMFTEIRDLIHDVVVARFNVLELRLNAIEAKLDAAQGVSGTLGDAQRV